MADVVSDAELRERLQAIDEDEDVDVSQWEGEFLDSVVYKYHGPLSERQRECALQILEKYE